MKLSNDFWNDMNRVFKKMLQDKNFAEFWTLEDKYPKFVNAYQNFSDKFIVPLHNRNVVKKRISLNEKIIMYLKAAIGSWGKPENLLNSIAKYPDLKTWYENAEFTVYRGIPAYKEYDENATDVDKMWKVNFDSARNLEKIKENMSFETGYRSFTLDIKTAIKFTQANWAGRGWINEKERNGFIFEGKIKVSDVHIFQNEGGEEECVISAPFKCNKYHLVKYGKIMK